jgi:hypothetical protein
MIIEAILFLAVVTAVEAAIAKVCEWRHDVLYGPYQRQETKRPANNYDTE